MSYGPIHSSLPAPLLYAVYPQAQPTGSKLSDPKRYSSEQLAEFLASLSSQQPHPRAPGKAPLKPQKLLKRYLPWLAARIQVWC
jgi:hypothetical protein